jgi:hypothetical protein
MLLFIIINQTKEIGPAWFVDARPPRVVHSDHQMVVAVELPAEPLMVVAVELPVEPLMVVAVELPAEPLDLADEEEENSVPVKQKAAEDEAGGPSGDDEPNTEEIKKNDEINMNEEGDADLMEIQSQPNPPIY